MQNLLASTMTIVSNGSILTYTDIGLSTNLESLTSFKVIELNVHKGLNSHEYSLQGIVDMRNAHQKAHSEEWT